jgi:hypothetical protein
VKLWVAATFGSTTPLRKWPSDLLKNYEDEPKRRPLHGSPARAARGRCPTKHWVSRECARCKRNRFSGAVKYFEPGAKITILSSRRLSPTSYGEKTRLECSDQARTVITVTLSPGVLRWTLKGCTMLPLAAWTSRHEERGICLKLRNYYTPLRLKNT